MRCSDCSKFVSLVEADAEVNSLEVDEDGHVTAEVRIANTCADCGGELTESSFDVDDTITMPDPVEGHMHDLQVEEVSCERTQPSHDKPPKPGVKGKATPARYRKTFYGFELEVRVTCSGCGLEEQLTLADDIQASAMDTL